MDRRKALIMTGTLVGGSTVGVVTLTTAFKPEVPAAESSKRLAYKQGESAYEYSPLSSVTTAGLAYQIYDQGGCMYASFKSVVSQLADQVGEPFTSFPFRMLGYGHGGIGGYGTVCGALNGAAALIGLLVPDRKNQDYLIKSLFQWYEESQLPQFIPPNPSLDFTPPMSISRSVLCHASNSNWSKASGYKIKAKQQKERCRRLTADVVMQAVTGINQYFSNNFKTSANENETIRTCMTCHGQEGKLANTSGKMHCSACHPESLGHKLFSDVHYKLLKEK